MIFKIIIDLFSKEAGSKANPNLPGKILKFPIKPETKLQF